MKETTQARLTFGLAARVTSVPSTGSSEHRSGSAPAPLPTPVALTGASADA